MKQGLEYILDHDKKDSINVCAEDQFADPTFLMILAKEDRQRLHIIHDEGDFPICDYAINTYRRPDMFTCEKDLDTLSVDGLPILSITNCQK